MKTVCMIYEQKNGGKYEETYRTEDKTTVYERFSNCMVAKYINRAPWVKRITSSTNYDGTYNYTIYDDRNGRFKFTIER